MIEAVFMMGGLGLLVGAGLAAASKVFYVYVDPLIVKIDDVLPGANCGGCGMPGCAANAEAIVAGKAAADSCVAAGPEVAEAIAEIMGLTIEAKEPDIALPGCTYGVLDADLKYFYEGLNDCRAAALLSGGMKVCNIGCMGLGTCAKACPFDAIIMGPQGLPVVDEEKCTGCGTCERVCPKNIINLSSVTRRIMREYTTDDCTTPCQRACPAGINISEYISQIAEGNYLQAVQVIKERNPFPSVIGRICPRPCENDCRRQLIDEPVAINFLKRFAADYEREQGQRVLPFMAPATSRNIAIIGGGVQGLSTAFFSARLGHEVTIFEATDKLGGLLNSAISAYRLDENILQWDIDGILEMGVKAETNKMMGRDFMVADLLAQGFDSVFLASGGWDSRLTRPQGKPEIPIPDTCLLIDFIKSEVNDKEPISCGSNVVISGGNALAVEAALKAKKLGCQKVIIILRENDADQPLTKAELQTITENSIELHIGSGVNRLFGKDNHLTGIEIVDLNNQNKQKIAAQTLILAAGRFPELIFNKTETDTEPSDSFTWESLSPYKQPAYCNEVGLYAKGDALTDFSEAIKAIGAGRRAASTIHQAIYDILEPLPENVLTPQSVIQDVDHLENVITNSRQIMPLNTGETLVQTGEQETGFSEESAQIEAKRCLQCGLICYKRTEILEQKSL